MPTFAYSGRTRGGENVTGERVADNADAAVAALRRDQILVTRIAATKEKAGAAAATAKKGKLGKKVNPKNLAVFVRQFSVMIDAGLPLVQCLEILGQPGGRQELRGDHSGNPIRRRKRRVARGRDEEASEDVRSALHQHDRGGRGGRYSRHDSETARDLHRKSGQVERASQVGDGVSGRRHRHRRGRCRRHPVEGHPDVRCVVRRTRRAAAAADAHRHRAQQLPRQLHAVHHPRHRRRRLCLQGVLRNRRRQAQDRRHHAEAARAWTADAEDRGGPVLPDAFNAAELGRADSRRARHHRSHVGQLRHRRSHPADTQEHRARRDDLSTI